MAGGAYSIGLPVGQLAECVALIRFAASMGMSLVGRDNKVKITVLGAGGVGKSCLALRLTTGYFEDEYDPTINDMYEHELTVDDQAYNLDINDTAGQAEYASVVSHGIRNGEGFLIVSAVDSKSSLERLEELRNQILILKNDPQIPIIIAHNKCDMDKHQAEESEVKALAEEWKCPYLMTSAKEKINVTEVFSGLVRQIVAYRKNAKSKTEAKTEEPGGCCVIS